MTPLEAFLRAEDLDDVLRARQRISSLTSEETARIESIIREWTDRQAIANLLFHAGLIPESVRFEALERALHSSDIPYFALAATVGFQEVALNDVPDDMRPRWLRALTGFARGTSKVMAGRASVVLFNWCQSLEPYDILPEVLSLYPVPDTGAGKNIVAAALARISEMSNEELDHTLAEWRLSSETSAVIKKAHEKYHVLKVDDPLRAMIMKSPGFSFIPNLKDFTDDDFISPGIKIAEHHAKRPWWRPW